MAIAIGVSAPVAVGMLTRFSLDAPRFAALMLSVAAMSLAIVFGPRMVPRYDRLLLGASGALLAAIFLSSVLSHDMGQALTYGAENSLMSAPSLFAMVLVFLLATRVESSEPIRVAVLAGVAFTALGGAVGIFEVITGGRIAGGLGNGNYLGVMLLLFLPLAIDAARRADPGMWRAGWVTVVATMVAAALMTKSITVITVMLVQLLWVYAWLVRPSGPGSGARDTRRRIGISLGIVTVVIVVVALVGISPLRDVTYGLVRDTLEDANTVSRIEMWKAAIATWQESPFVGAGPDGLPQASQGHISRELVRTAAGQGTGIEVLIRDPHSLPLLVLSSGGLLGLIASAFLLLAWIRSVRGRGVGAGPEESFRRACVLGFVGFLLCTLFIPWTIRFCAAPALVAGLSVLKCRSGPKASPRMDLRRSSWIASSLAVAVSIVALILGVTSIAGEVVLQRADRAESPSVMVETLEQAVVWQPTRVRLHYEVLRAKGIAMTYGMFPAETYRSEVDVASDAILDNGAYLVGLVRPELDALDLLGGGQPGPWAAGLLDRAVMLTPEHPDVLLERAHVALLSNEIDRASMLLGAAAELGLSSPRRLLYDYRLALLLGDTVVADGLSRRIRLEAPWLTHLL